MIEIIFNGLRLEYALGGNYNYISWKDMKEAILEDNVLKEFIDNDVPKLYESDFLHLPSPFRLYL